MYPPEPVTRRDVFEKYGYYPTEEQLMRINDVYQDKSDLLKAEDLRSQEHELEIEKWDIKEFDSGNKILLRFKGREKGLVLNKTNARKIAAEYGDMVEEWVGKKIIVYPDTTEYQGKMVPCIRVRIPLAKADFDPNSDIPF